MESIGRQPVSTEGVWQSGTGEAPAPIALPHRRYHLVDQWTLDATLREVVAILRRPEELPRWWPAVFLTTEVLQRGGKDEVGTRVLAHAKGWLPYTLQFTFEITKSYPPRGCELKVRGDLEGSCLILVVENEFGLRMDWNWQCSVNRPVLRFFARLWHRLGAWNHRWTMRQGCRSLQLEIDRRRMPEVDTIGPPRPVFPHDRVTRAVLGFLRG